VYFYFQDVFLIEFCPAQQLNFCILIYLLLPYLCCEC